MLDVSRSPSIVVRELPVDLIQPDRHQARKHFDPAALQELADSIRESGVIQPIVVRPHGSGYELIAGERRWRASQLAGLHHVPAIVRNDLSDDECVVLGLIENLQRESLAPIDAAAGIQRLCQVADLTHWQVGERIGKSREYVSGFLRLLTLEPDVAARVNDGSLSVGHGKLLAGLAPHQQRAMASQAIESRMSVRALERALAAAGGKPSEARAKPAASADHLRLEQGLSDVMGASVTVIEGGGGRGHLKIDYSSLEQLDGILEKLGYRG